MEDIFIYLAVSVFLIISSSIILKNIFKYYKNTTFIIVSHRLNNMDLFDKVLSLENNNINVLERNDSYYE